MRPAMNPTPTPFAATEWYIIQLNKYRILFGRNSNFIHSIVKTRRIMLAKEKRWSFCANELTPGRNIGMG